MTKMDEMTKEEQ